MPDLSQVVEAVALGVIGLAFENGCDEMRNERRVHLPVAIHFHNDLGTLFQRRRVPRHHSRPHALVDFMQYDADAGVLALFLHQPPRLFRAGIINHKNAIHLRTDFRQDTQDVISHLVARDDDGDKNGHDLRELSPYCRDLGVTIRPHERAISDHF